MKHSTTISQIKTDGTFYIYIQIKNENQGYRPNQSITDWVVDIVTTNEQNEDGIGRLDLIIKKHTQEISANGIVPLVHTLYGVGAPSLCSESTRKWPEMASMKMVFKLRRVETSYTSAHTLSKTSIP